MALSRRETKVARSLVVGHTAKVGAAAVAMPKITTKTVEVKEGVSATSPSEGQGLPTLLFFLGSGVTRGTAILYRCALWSRSERPKTEGVII